MVIDPKAFSDHEARTLRMEQRFSCYCQECTVGLKADDELLLDIRRLLLVPTQVEVYVLASRKWARVPLQGLLHIYYDPGVQILDRLALEESVKNSLKMDLTAHLEKRRRHFLSLGSSFDLVHSRSRTGLIFHFHGQ